MGHSRSGLIGKQEPRIGSTVNCFLSLRSQFTQGRELLTEFVIDGRFHFVGYRLNLMPDLFGRFSGLVSRLEFDHSRIFLSVESPQIRLRCFSEDTRTKVSLRIETQVSQIYFQ